MATEDMKVRNSSSLAYIRQGPLSVIYSVMLDLGDVMYSKMYSKT
jgi:hypothetical protein